ncbi:hypothetical protein OZX61_12405 (plasmid) [Acinetobacter sp. ESL0695]|uniref:hypothetical protein n=1 Tax=Acinetobacter sp. ESL0695 TaxID=2983215 RepID=UPI0023F281B1|nr:hypothetical protein [Acinetobacter sp. ESL0695]WEV50132.1 hypothetical protein OZX61_12405 [Acinetobacter sp. ESL0695]
MSTVFFYNDGVEGFSKYSLKLPFGINFSMTSNDLLETLGNPIFYRKNEEGVLVSQKWSFENIAYTLFVSYSISGYIRYISLSIPDES